MFFRVFIFLKPFVPILQKLSSGGLPRPFWQQVFEQGAFCDPSVLFRVAFCDPSSLFQVAFYVRAFFILFAEILFSKLDTIQLERHLIIYAVHIH